MLKFLYAINMLFDLFCSERRAILDTPLFQLSEFLKVLI